MKFTLALITLAFGVATSKKMTPELYALKMEAVQKLASPLFAEDGNVDLDKVTEFAGEVLTHIKNYEEPEHNDPLYNLYNQLGIQNTQLGQCLNNYKEKKMGAMKWMGVAMMAATKCKIEHFKESFLQEDCAKEGMKGWVPMLLGKAIKAKKMAYKTKKAAKMVSLTCDAEETYPDTTVDSIFASLGQKTPVSHHIKGPFCMMAACTRMMKPEDEKAICSCMQKEFADQGIPVTAEMLEPKIQWFTDVLSALDGASGSELPELPALPEAMREYDPLYSGECVVKHCDQSKIANILKMTGMADAVSNMQKLMVQFGDDFRNMLRQKCQCMQQNFGDAPLFAEDNFDCNDDSQLNILLGIGSNAIEQHKQCSNYILGMLNSMKDNLDAPSQ